MPPRSSARLTQTVAPSAKTKAATSPASLPTFQPQADTVRRAHIYFYTSITLLWVLVLSFGFGLSLVLIVLSSRIRLNTADQRLLTRRLDVIQTQLSEITRQTARPSAAATDSTGALGLNTSTSPSGALTRGSVSPDGKKYAGYEDKARGKLGLSLEMLDTGQLKRIEIFNPLTESTGVGTSFEGLMSVRWKDARTIEYEVLVKRQGVQSKETRTAKIFF